MRLPMMLCNVAPQVPGSTVTYPAPKGFVDCGVENSGGISSVAVEKTAALVAV